jgi:hypothetical protein
MYFQVQGYQALGTMSEHDVAITLFLDIADTMRTEIEVKKLFLTEADDFTLAVPYALKVN